MPEPKINALHQNQETLAYFVNHPSFVFRCAYGRSADSRKNNDLGQDYIAYQASDDRLVFALCDGVSQSFLGDLAARVLGEALVQWMMELDAEMLADQAAASALEKRLLELTEDASEMVANQRYPDDMVGMVQIVLEKKRALGSESTFVAGALDFKEGWFVFAWMGDTRLRLWDVKGEQTNRLGSTFHTRERWSTRKGLVGDLHFFTGSLANMRHFIAYSDGLARLDQAIKQDGCSNQALDAFLDEAAEQPNSDDTSLFEWWASTPQFARRPAAPEQLRFDRQADGIALSWSPVSRVNRYEVSLRSNVETILETAYTSTVSHYFSEELVGQRAHVICVRGWQDDEPGEWRSVEIDSPRAGDQTTMQASAPGMEESVQHVGTSKRTEVVKSLPMAAPWVVPPASLQSELQDVSQPGPTSTSPGAHISSVDSQAHQPVDEGPPSLEKKVVKRRPTRSFTLKIWLAAIGLLACLAITTLVVVSAPLWSGQWLEFDEPITTLVAEVTVERNSTHTPVPNDTPTATNTNEVTDTPITPSPEMPENRTASITEGGAEASGGEAATLPIVTPTEQLAQLPAPTVTATSTLSADPAGAAILTSGNLDKVTESIAVTLNGPNGSSLLSKPVNLTLVMAGDDRMLGLVQFTPDINDPNADATYLYEINLKSPGNWIFIKSFPRFTSVAFNGQTIAGVSLSSELSVWQNISGEWQESETFKKQVQNDICAVTFHNNDLYTLNRSVIINVYKGIQAEKQPLEDHEKRVSENHPAVTCSLTVHSDEANPELIWLAASYDTQFFFGEMKGSSVKLRRSYKNNQVIEILISSSKGWWVGVTDNIYYYSRELFDRKGPFGIMYKDFTINSSQNFLIALPRRISFDVTLIDFAQYIPGTGDLRNVYVKDVAWETADKVVFSPDGRFLVTLSEIDEMKIWFSVQ